MGERELPILPKFRWGVLPPGGPWGELFLPTSPPRASQEDQWQISLYRHPGNYTQCCAFILPLSKINSLCYPHLKHILFFKPCVTVEDKATLHCIWIAVHLHTPSSETVIVNWERWPCSNHRDVSWVLFTCQATSLWKRCDIVKIQIMPSFHPLSMWKIRQMF